MSLRSTRFVVLAKTRSGSKWLVELLDSHPDVACYGEMLGGDQVPADYGAVGRPRFTSWVVRSRMSKRLPVSYAQIVYLRDLLASQPAMRAVGVKLVYGHLTPALLRYFSARRVRVLHLVRSNVFDALLSYEVAKARGLFATRDGDAVSPVRVAFDPSTLRERLEEHEFAITRARAAILHYRLPWLDVEYEELVARREETLSSVCRFLGVQPAAHRLRSTFAPVDDVPREDVIANLDEVADALAGTRFEWMLREPRRAQSTHALG